MTPVNMREQPGTHKVILAENQRQYMPLPALIREPDRIYVTEWEMSEADRETIAAGGVVRVAQWVGHVRTCSQCGCKDPALFQPVMVHVVPEQHRLPLEPVQ